jgi:peptidoglycan/LPS O-acetylase OafA/YrhL
MINLGNISKYRGQLMGFAIIIVMLFHVNTPRGDAFYGLRRMGNLGVDIFFFLSGIGLWFSWAKQQNWKRFYYNRALRIYPIWLIVAGYYYISRFNPGHASYALPFGGTGNAVADSWIDLFGDVLFNWDFWLHDELTFWYVPATMMMYLFAPLYMELVRRHGVMRWLTVLPLMWCIIVQYVTPIHQAVGHIEIFWSRVPIFMLGINIAEAVRQNRETDGAAWWMIVPLWVLSLGSCIWLEQMRHGKFPLYTERMLYIVLAVTTIFIVSEALRRCSWRPVHAVLSWVGGISLEIYLTHVEFIYKPLQRMQLGYWPTFLLMLAISLPVAWIASKICSYIIKGIKGGFY